MPSSSQPKRPLVTLCAAISLDGRLDLTEPRLRTVLPTLAPEPGEGLLLDEDVELEPPSAWIPSTAVIYPAGMSDLAYNLGISPPRTQPIRHWFCLGGPALFRALFAGRLVDDVRLLVRACVDGRQGSPTLSGPPTPEFFPRSLACRLLSMEARSGECLLRYRVLRHGRATRK